MARSRLTSLRQSRSTERIQDPSYERPRFPLPPARREEREAAAIKLQAVERGILARSRVQRMREASTRGSAKDTGTTGATGTALPADALALQVPGILGQGAPCSERPPQIWRHFGCHRWDCGDLGGEAEACNGTSSSSLCRAPDWRCSEGSEIQEHGAFACIDGRWADVLPLCLGDTSPESPGGTWMQLESAVRAVLFQLRVSWIPASVYEVDICSGRSRTGALLLPCERVDFATLITKSVWPLILFSLQASLCSPALPLELPTLLPNQSWAECNGRLSRSGDRLRLAGMSADFREGSGEPQLLKLFLEAIPGRGTDAELLRADLLSLFNAFGRESGLTVPSSEWHSASGLPREALWLSEGLQRLQAHPTLFNIRADTEFFGTDWLPSLQVSLPKEPYIINSHRLPGWILETVPTVGPDRSLESLQMLQGLEEIASILCICVPAAAWMLMLILRCLWDMIFGGRRPWSFGSTARSLCRLALLMQAVEMAVYTLAAALIAWVMDGTDWVLLYELILQILSPSAVLLLLPSLAFGPSGLATLQLLRAPAHCLPGRSRVCCCRLKRQAWARFFALSALWHALACSAALTEAVRLVSAGLGMDAPGFQRALQMCRWDLEDRCQSSSWRQVPDTRWDLHLRCALACSDVTVSIDDIVLGAMFVICKLVAISAGWSLLARLWCLHLAWRLLVLAAQLARVPKVPQDASLDSATEVGEHGEPAAEVLTPSAFQQGVSEAVDKVSARTHNEEPQAPSPVARRALSEAGEASKLQVLQAVMSLDRPPSPSGSAASLDLSDRAERPSAETLKNMLENPLTDGHAELVDFARAIARQCSKGSQALSEASGTSSGRSITRER
ncbi:slc47a1 [Symbiodinium sp. CCMP2456]|nr:slc47a1 [Symbiodinium sp. CCMP2456]